MTAPTKTEAKEIVMELLEHGLIACANILPGAESFYVWNEEIQHEKEVVVIFKANTKNEAQIIKIVRKIHSYECPCIVFVPIANGSADFLKWVKESC